MNDVNGPTVHKNIDAPLPKIDEPEEASSISASLTYRAINQGDVDLLDASNEAKSHSVDFRYVPHGQGPCACCGPHSE